MKAESPMMDEILLFFSSDSTSSMDLIFELRHRLWLFGCRENEKESFLFGAIHFSCFDLYEVKSNYSLDSLSQKC